MFVLSFKTDPTRDSFDKYYMPLAEIKDFNVLIEYKPFLIILWKTNKKHMKNLSKCREMMAIEQEIY